MDALVWGREMAWVLSTSFGRMVFVMIFITWGLILVNLFLLMMLLVRKVFGGFGRKQSQPQRDVYLDKEE